MNKSEIKNLDDSDSIKKIKEELENLIGLDIIKQEEKIKEISQREKITQTTLKKQFQQIIKEKEKKKNLSSESVDNLSNKIGSFFYKKDLAEKIIELQPCYYDKARNWWLWNWSETKWERVDETDILNAIERQATINTINSKEKNEMLEALKQVSRKNQPADIKPTWIQFKNEILDIETGEKFRALPQWFVTNPIPWKLHEEGYELTPKIDEIFEEWVGKDYVQVLYEILAYCMIPDYPIHRIFCFIGPGLNGKSCFLNLLRKFIGEKNCASSELDNLLNSRFEVTRLHKKLVCIMGETNFSKIEKTSMLKKLSGGDLIGFEYKNKDPFEDTNYAKILISTNNLPTTDDKTIGFYRRWMIIDFPNRFSEKEDILKKIPDEEYNALASKCCIILKELLQKRAFEKEGRIEDKIKKYEDYSNPLGKFLKEFTDEDPNGYIWKWEFEKNFNNWCKSNRFRAISGIEIGKMMKELDFKQSQRFVGDFSQGKRWRVWEGIKWKANTLLVTQDEQDEHINPTWSYR